tara:strand:- start:595 stop:696 length:102 start_codon:yes stop_codon:yes gene_type:complete
MHACILYQVSLVSAFAKVIICLAILVLAVLGWH